MIEPKKKMLSLICHLFDDDCAAISFLQGFNVLRLNNPATMIVILFDDPACWRTDRGLIWGGPSAGASIGVLLVAVRGLRHGTEATPIAMPLVFCFGANSRRICM